MSATNIPYRVVIIRDQQPKLLVFITNEYFENLAISENHDVQGMVTILAEIPLNVTGLEKELELLFAFDQCFLKGVLKYIFQHLILLGINFQKSRVETNGMKDNEGW